MLSVDSDDDDPRRLSARSSFGDQVSLVSHYEQHHRLVDSDLEEPDLYGMADETHVQLHDGTLEVIDDVDSPDERPSGRVNLNRSSDSGGGMSAGENANASKRDRSGRVATQMVRNRRAANYSSYEILSAASPTDEQAQLELLSRRHGTLSQGQERRADDGYAEAEGSDEDDDQDQGQDDARDADDDARDADNDDEYELSVSTKENTPLLAVKLDSSPASAPAKQAGSYGAIDARQYQNRFSAREAADAASLNEVSVEGMPLLGEDAEPLELKQTKRLLCCSVPHYCGCNLFTMRQIFTWERMKILLILAVTLLAFLMFTSQKEVTLENAWELGAVDVERPLHLEIDTTKRHAIIELTIIGQQLPPEAEGLNITVNSELQGGLVVNNQSTWERIGVVETLELSTLMEVEGPVVQYEISEKDRDHYAEFRMQITTGAAEPLGLTTRLLQLSDIIRYEVIIAAVILIGMYVLIIFELVHRTIAALLGSFVAIAFLSVLRERPSMEVVISWIDFDTIGLLFGMMLMVGIFSETGFFEWCAVKAFKLARGNLWYLTVILCIFTAVISAFLDNVTTILLLTPVTIQLCRVIDIAPEPILLAEIMYSNIGGTATAVGDPPNVIIINDRRIQVYDDQINFTSFLLHLGPGVVLTMLVVFVFVYWRFRSSMQRTPHHGKQKEIEIWRRTAARIRAADGDEERVVLQQLEEFIARLEEEAANSPDPNEVKPIDIGELEKKYVIHNWPLFISSCTVLGTVILFFFLHSAIDIDLSLAWIAIIGAMIHLVVSGIRDVDEILEKIEIGVLLFFGGLFVCIAALEQLGLIEFFADATEHLIGLAPEGKGREALAVVVILWLSALASAFIDNIPFTTAMVPVVVALYESDLGLPLGPLVWALCFGAYVQTA